MPTNAPPLFQQLGVIGCGLIGGSFAMAMKQAGLVQRVVGYSKSPSTTQKAQRLGVIDRAAESALLAVSGSDIVLLAVPVSATESTLRAIRHLIEPGVLFMDVGSTKADVARAAERALGPRAASFVPAHPVAGKEKSGVEHAEAGLFHGRQTILTPIELTDPALVQRATDVWSALGCQVLKMTPANHDAAFAAISHLPHLLASAYFNAIARQPNGQDYLSLGGPGFRDFTRIAAADPALWRDVFSVNKAEVLSQLALLRAELARYEQALSSDDTTTLETLLRQASSGRTAWQMGARPRRR